MIVCTIALLVVDSQFWYRMGSTAEASASPTLGRRLDPMLARSCTTSANACTHPHEIEAVVLPVPVALDIVH
ncbi:hypothetical protein OH77DRAFT_589771 [Trametes cingulata]|nr:hypothetical protein OH77DRAFT_589771 [Trametes cingulata]